MDKLSKIAKKYITDKGLGGHGYTPIYDKYFKDLNISNLLEIGIGGYERDSHGGGSLKMWKEYFSNAVIHGVDIHDKSFVNSDRIKTYVIDQTDSEGLNKLIDDIGSPDIIIDDASHINQKTVETFKILFKRLKEGGIYVIEDTHTSYWNDIYGGTVNLNGYSVMNFFKTLSDYLNIEHIPDEGKKKEVMELTENFGIDKIVSIHFYKQLIFIFKQ